MMWQIECHIIMSYHWHLNATSSPFSHFPSFLSPMKIVAAAADHVVPPPPTTTIAPSNPFSFFPLQPFLVLLWYLYTFSNFSLHFLELLRYPRFAIFLMHKEKTKWKKKKKKKRRECFLLVYHISSNLVGGQRIKSKGSMR